MYEAIHYDDDKATVDMNRYLRRHDIVYYRPALSGSQGLPVGTGTVGGLVYHTQNGFEMTVNHTDAYDFMQDGPMQAWAWEAEEKNTAPVSCGKLSVNATLPVFDWIYLQEYEERLNLAEAVIEGHARTPFAETGWKIYAVKESGLVVFELEIRQTEDAALTIQLEKWPSPSFFHHYEQIVDIHDKNLSCVKTEAAGETAIIRQNLRKCNTALAAYCENSRLEEINSHTLQLAFPKRKNHKIKLYLSAQAGNTGEEAGKAIAEIEQAKKNDNLFWQHCVHWRTFWEKSFVHLPSHVYLENIYYIHLYQMGSSSLGKYPLTFAGLWGWFRDSRNWGHFYHWNHQQNYWGLHAAGHPELAENYLNYRFEMLPRAKEDARKLFHVEGAFYSDISNMNGYNAIEPDTVRNLSVGAQISLDFYRHYLYTGDAGFLKEKALPVMKACAEFYMNMLEERDGELLIKGGSTAYESYWNLKKSITDRALLQSLLQVLISLEGTEGTEIPTEAYKEAARRLYRTGTEEITHNGRQMEIYCTGESWDGRKVSYGQGEYPLSPFPATLMTPVFPAELIGLDKKESVEFQVMQNTARVLFDRDIYQLGTLGCSGHTPAPETAARLGMKEDMFPILEKYIKAYQIFPNGLMHFADVSQNQQWAKTDRPQVLPADIQSTQWDKVHEHGYGKRTQIESDYFLHCYFEAAANVFAGTQEMLLQSYRGVIRVFPALPDGESAMFTLWAQGGFAVTSECVKGDIRYIALKSRGTKMCRVLCPWRETPVTVLENGERKDFSVKDGILDFEAAADSSYMIFRSEFPPENYYHNSFDYYVNREVRKMGPAQIGLEAYY